MVSDHPGIVMFSRGCPYSCLFCENKIFQKRRTVYRPPINVYNEMLELKKFGRKDIFIYDDELVGQKVPKGWMKEVADLVGPLGFNMLCHGRCNKRYITDEVMQDAKRAGINTVFWGVESFSPTVLDALNKKETPEDIWHSLRTAKKAGINNGLYIMTGCYKETPSEAAITYESLKEACAEGLVDYLQVFVMAVFPGTEMEKIAKSEGWYGYQPKSWITLKHIPNKGTPWMNFDEIKKWRQMYKSACPDKSEAVLVKVTA